MDLLLNPETHDLQVNAYDLQLASGLQLVEQRLKQTLWFFFGEWYLDTTDGVPYFEEIFVKSPSRNVVEGLIKVAILKVENVEEILSFEIEYDSATREGQIEFSVKTEFGNLEISEAVNGGIN